MLKPLVAHHAEGGTTNILSTAGVTCGMVGVHTHELGSICHAHSAAGRDTGYGIERKTVA